MTRDDIGRAQQRSDEDSQSDREAVARERRLGEDPLYFAFVAMQSSGTKHGNSRSTARDSYYFGSMLYGAITHRRDLDRLFAMVEFAGDSAAPFEDARSNLILDALRFLHAESEKEPSLLSLVDVLKSQGTLEAVGGLPYLQARLSELT